MYTCFIKQLSVYILSVVPMLPPLNVAVYRNTIGVKSCSLVVLV